VSNLKTERRWALTKFLVGTVVLFLIILAGLVGFGYNVSSLVIAYGTYTTFSAAIIAANLATKPDE